MGVGESSSHPPLASMDLWPYWSGKGRGTLAQFDLIGVGLFLGASIEQRAARKDSPVACVAVDAPALVADMGPLLISPHHQHGSHPCLARVR